MKTTIQELATNETGAVLVMALVALVVGALLLTPMLGLMSTGLMGGQIYEEKMHELYAADAGVEDAIWKLMNPEVSELPHKECGDEPWSVTYPKDGDPPFVVNDKNVGVTIQYLGEGIFEITSTADSTTVLSYVHGNYEEETEWDHEYTDGETIYNIGGDGEYETVHGTGTLTVTENIEGDAIVYVDGNLILGANIEGNAQVYVTGDLTLTGVRRRPMSGNIEDPVTVCVEGNLTVTGNIEDESRVYVLGDLVLTAEREPPPPSGNIQSGAGACVEGTITAEKIEGSSTIVCACDTLTVNNIEGADIYAPGHKPFLDCALPGFCDSPECEVNCECPIVFEGAGAGGGSGGGWSNWRVTTYLINP